MIQLEDEIKAVIRDVPDFPKSGIIFKDITPILLQPQLVKRISKHLAEQMQPFNPTAVAAIESRGFFFGLPLAAELGVPFIPVRKKGKLPYKTISYSYALEYGTAEIEMHEDALKNGDRVIVHDDLLATGGTAAAASELIQQLGASVCAFSFLVNLSFLNGEANLKKYAPSIVNLVNY